MSNQARNQYRPDTVSPPGETLLETLEAMGMTQAELAERTGRPQKTINEIVKGKSAITPETALQLERVLGVPAGFWNNRESAYREYLARAQEHERLVPAVSWLRQFPVAAMVRLGWIEKRQDPVERVREILGYFGVASPRQWQEVWAPQATFRQSPAFQADPGAVAAWLRRGEIEGQQIECTPYDRSHFHAALLEARALTEAPPEHFQPTLTALLAQAGVALVFVPELPKIRASGATQWLTPKKALLQLSLRYKTDDQLWFTFFHEAGHILLHGKRDFFIEESGQESEEEAEADRFAADLLIPPADWRRIAGRGRYSQGEILAFAAEIGIAPGIVVGRLQHEGDLPPNYCNDLKRRLEWGGNGDAPLVVESSD
jgi:addiction module HigA family antidote